MADDTEDGAEDERTIELSAIQAIYPELSFDPSDEFSAHIDVPVEPQTPLPLRSPNSSDCSQSIDLSGAVATLNLDKEDSGYGSTGQQDRRNLPAESIPANIHYLSYLPSLKLKISLPNGYPTTKPPRFEIQSSWLYSTKLKELEEEGANIWEGLGREPVVFAYIDFLREAADDAFGLISDDGARLDISTDLMVSLLDHDLKVKRMKFEQETFECGICLGATFTLNNELCSC